jgi:hypothetical protein
VWRLRALVGHLEEQQIGKLLHVIAVALPVVAEVAAVVPEFGNDRGRGHLTGTPRRDCRCRAG